MFRVFHSEAEAREFKLEHDKAHRRVREEWAHEKPSPIPAEEARRQLAEALRDGRHLKVKVQPKALIGAASEAMVCADLLSRGLEVYRAFSPQSSCDLVVRAGGEFYGVEVKTVRGNSLPPCQPSKFEILALVTSRTIRYIYSGANRGPAPLTLDTECANGAQDSASVTVEN
jgi:Holliday junction resolvase-like predicted endonuclease